MGIEIFLKKQNNLKYFKWNNSCSHL